MNLRLNTLAEMVTPGSRIADIGTDHAYLPIELVKQGKVSYAIASDIAKGPLDNAQKDIQAAGFASQIETRLGAGLSTVKPADHIDTVIVAGMGGKLISSILNDAYLKGFRFQTLVLEPNVGESLVRSWLMIHAYKIVQEKLLRESGHNYELIKAEYTGQILPLTEEQLLFGPLILQNKDQVFKKKWQDQLLYQQKLLQNLNKAKNKNLERIRQVENEISLIKEELK